MLDAGVQDDRRPGADPRASARARSRAASSTSASAAAPSCRRPSTRPSRVFFGEAAEAENVRAIGQPEVDVTDVPARGRPGPQVHRRDRRAPRDRRCPTSTASRSRSTTSRSPTPTSRSASPRCASASAPSSASSAPSRTATSSPSTWSPPSATRRSTRSTASATRSAAATCSRAWTRRCSACPPARPRPSPRRWPAATTRARTPSAPSPCSRSRSASCPTLDDEFAELASEFDTLDELRADVVTQAEQAKKFEQGVQARDKVLEHLLETVDVPVPDGVVEAEVQPHLEGENRLEDDEHRAEVDESTRKALRAQFLLDAIAEQLEVQVEQPELIEYLVMSAQQYGMDPNEFAQAIDQQGQIPSIVPEVARRKALAAVLEKATVTDTAGAAVDLDELVPQRPRRHSTTTSTTTRPRHVGTRGVRRRGRSEAPAASPASARRCTRPARLRHGGRRRRRSTVRPGSGAGSTAHGCGQGHARPPAPRSGAQRPSGRGVGSSAGARRRPRRGDEPRRAPPAPAQGSTGVGAPRRAHPQTDGERTRRRRRPSSATAHQPTHRARPFARRGCSTVVSACSSHGRSTPSKPVTVRSSGTRSPSGLGGPHDAGGQQVGLRDDRGRRATCGRDVEQQPCRTPPRPRRQVVRPAHGGRPPRRATEPASPADGVRNVAR